MKKMIFLKVFFISVLFVFSVSSFCFAGSPMEEIKSGIDKMLTIMNGSDTDVEKEKLVKAVADELFFWPEIAKRSLGRNWKKFTADQRKEFTDVFSELIKSVYFDKMLSGYDVLSGYQDVKIVYLGQDTNNNSWAEVRTEVIQGEGAVSVVYKMLQKNNQWRIYDVVIENVSLLKNYRSQFSYFLANKSPKELIETLKEKIQDLQSKHNQE